MIVPEPSRIDQLIRELTEVCDKYDVTVEASDRYNHDGAPEIVFLDKDTGDYLFNIDEINGPDYVHVPRAPQHVHEWGEWQPGEFIKRRFCKVEHCKAESRELL